MTLLTTRDLLLVEKGSISQLLRYSGVLVDV